MNPEMASIAFKMVTALGATLLAFGGVAWILKKLQTSGGLKGLTSGKRSAARAIEVSQHAAIGPGRTLHLVRCYGKTLLVGSTAQSISLIAELDEEEVEASNDFASSLVESFRERGQGAAKRKAADDYDGIARV